MHKAGGGECLCDFPARANAGDGHIRQTVGIEINRLACRCACPSLENERDFPAPRLRRKPRVSNVPG